MRRRKGNLLRCLCFCLIGELAQAQEVMPLYPGVIPGAKVTPSDYKELTAEKDGKVTGLSKVFFPELRLFQPPSKDKSNGTAVIICPGGGYAHLAIGHEGDDVARRFAAIGVTAIVLKYRLPDHEIMTNKALAPLQDAQQAIYMVRKNAAKWGIDSGKIGIMGFSAGGHLAASLAVHYKDAQFSNPEKLSLRPDFSILIYPVISFGPSTHTGSVQNLIGSKATAADRHYFSNEKHIMDDTPPTFLVHANDDTVVLVENSILFIQALRRKGVPVEAHLYQAGGHGFGMHNPTTTDDWFERLENWMKNNKLLKNSSAG